ncbi:MAG: hypothetical protein AAGJ46_07155 [Planctomycetota bacterium]
MRFGRLIAACVLLASPAFGESLERAIWPKPRPLVEEKLEALGIRVVRGDVLTLVTDLPPSPAVDELPRVATTAVEAFAEYFELTPPAGWRVQAFVMGDRERFAAAGLLPPAEHADFANGLSMGYELWVKDQPSDYYRRALLVHELTHSFMSTLLGGCGPGWYMEATAELMGAHAWDAESGELRVGIVPASKTDCPQWGRVPLVRKAGESLTAAAVMRVDNRQKLEVDAYAHVWALAKLLDTHPRYQARWRALPRVLLERDFNDRFRQTFAEDWRRLNQELRLLATTCEYGHDIAREAIDFQATGKPLGEATHRTPVRADRGWQPAGVFVEQGVTYRYKAAGEFVIAREPDGAPWPCQADGVTLRYHGGRPLGRLLAMVDGEPGFSPPIELGADGQFVAPAAGTLYLRVNDSPAELAENEGGLWVYFKRGKAKGERRVLTGETP